ncbi:MAG TPA: HEAT repeat domain-containing protein [Pyrinomonadaceae bacterium]
MTKLISKTLLVTLSLVLAVTTTTFGQRRNFQSQSQSQTESQKKTETDRARAQAAQTDAATVFRSARDLITDGQWARAQEKFSDYLSSYPNEKNLDAALYWMAYAQQKLAKYDDCRVTILRLMEKYPTSSWRDDARVLLAQVPGTYVLPARTYATTVQGAIAATPPADTTIVYAPADSLAPVAVAVPGGQGIGIGYGTGVGGSAWSIDDLGGPTSDDNPCEFKIVVLQALFQTDLQRGIMAATEWLKPGSTQTVRCKGAALTLLGRHGGKAVTPVILGVARSEQDVKLRARAIATLGATNDDSVVDALRDFALTSQDNDIIEASLYALSKHTGDRAIAVLADIATSGKTIGQRRLAISNISIRPGEPAVDALFRIYDADQNVDIRKAVIAGFGNRKSERAGNKLLEIARSSDNVELRKSAISAISRRGGDKAVEFLLNLYDNEKNEELKDQILNSLASGTVFVTTPGSTGYIAQSIGGSSRLNDQRVIQKLIDIAKNQQAPMERRKRAIGWLSRSNDPTVLKFLEELLR